MKTVVDAVNALKGIDLDWSIASNACTYVHPDGEAVRFTGADFNLCVAEMTEGLFVPLSDLNKRKAGGGVEILTDKDGNQYQKGAIYEFSDREDFKSSTTDRLDRIVNEKNVAYIFGTPVDEFKYCREASAVLGTITKAPLVLEDGAAYQFDFQNELNIVGIARTKDRFNGTKKMLCTAVGEDGYNAESCTNIVKLVPESK